MNIKYLPNIDNFERFCKSIVLKESIVHVLLKQIQTTPPVISRQNNHSPFQHTMRLQQTILKRSQRLKIIKKVQNTNYEQFSILSEYFQMSSAADASTYEFMLNKNKVLYLYI